jgi:hypothetical protein
MRAQQDTAITFLNLNRITLLFGHQKPPLKETAVAVPNIFLFPLVPGIAPADCFHKLPVIGIDGNAV